MSKQKPKKKNERKQTNPYHKTIKNVFVAMGKYANYTFFTIGKRIFVYFSFDEQQIHEILNFETMEFSLRKDLSKPEVIEVVQLKRSNRVRDDEAYLLPNMEEQYEEFWLDICEKQKGDLTEEQSIFVQIAIISEHSLEMPYDELSNNGALKKQAVTYDYFGEPIAYEETDRQWIDYFMAKGDIDSALEIHYRYVEKE